MDTLSAGALLFQEFVVGETLPLAKIQGAVLDFLKNRGDVVILGAQAVNAYVEEPRMTQDVDLLATHARELAVEIRDRLGALFGIAVRLRELKKDQAYRIYQVRKPKNRHLVDVRSAPTLPPTQKIGGILVPVPAELIAQKTISLVRRKGTPKSGTDWRDLAMLLLAFPELKVESGPVRDRLLAAGADDLVLAAWVELVAQEIVAEDDGF